MTTEPVFYEDENDASYIVNNATDEELVERGGDIPFYADPVRTYLQKIGKTALLNAEQETELSQRIEAGLYAGYLLSQYEQDSDFNEEVRATTFWSNLTTLAEEGAAAKQHMVEANLRLVVSIAKRYAGRGMPFLDVIQEGNIGLNHAVEMFDYKKGYKFSTYATWWIRQSITRSLADKSRVIRVPVHMNEKLVKLDRITRDINQTTGREATPEELAKEMGTTVPDVLQMIKFKRQEPVSLNKIIGETGGRGQSDVEVGDLIADDTVPGPEEAADKIFLSEALRSVLSYLSEQEADIITKRFGLDGKQPMTLDDIGKIYGKTRERIRQIEKKAMIRLQNPTVLKELQDFLTSS